MRIYFKVFISFLFLFNYIDALYAQNNTLISDTTNLSEVTILFAKIDSVKRTDSLRRIGLLREIEKLKGSDRQRRTLLKQLKEIESADSLHRVSLALELYKLKSDSSGFAVSPFANTLFFIHTRIGSFTARERAQAISERIERLYNDVQFSPDSLKVIVNELSADIVFNDRVIMTVNELEAQWFNKMPEQLAKEYALLISKEIKNQREENTIANIAMRIGEAVLILISITLIILLINFGFKYLRRRLFKVKDSMLDGIKIQGHKFLDRYSELRVILFIMKLIRGFLILLSIYFAMPLLFSLFPGTAGMAQTMLQWILEPLYSLYEQIVLFLPNFVTILVILTITHYLILFFRFIATEIEKGSIVLPGFYPDWAKSTFTLIKLMLVAFSFIVIFPYLPGSHSPIFRGVSVFLGILVSFGSTTAISNAVAGFVITYMRPFKVGDRIKIGEITGDVIEKSMLVTRLRTVKNEEITIPNSAVLSGHTLNYTTSAKDLGLILNTSVTIGYNAPWRKVHELLIQAALSTEGVIKEDRRKPFVLQTDLNDFYVSYQINAYTDSPHLMVDIYSELHQNIQNKFNEAGVEILSPHYRSLRDDNGFSIINKKD
jgi:small-conductance mechanosensitive channel